MIREPMQREDLKVLYEDEILVRRRFMARLLEHTRHSEHCTSSRCVCGLDTLLREIDRELPGEGG